MVVALLRSSLATVTLRARPANALAAYRGLVHRGLVESARLPDAECAEVRSATARTWSAVRNPRVMSPAAYTLWGIFIFLLGFPVPFFPPSRWRRGRLSGQRVSGEWKLLLQLLVMLLLLL